MEKKNATNRLFSNLIWSLKKVFSYNSKYVICLCAESVLRGITPIVVLLILQRVIEGIQYKTVDLQSVIVMLVVLSFFEVVSQLCQIFTQLKIENYELEFDTLFQEDVLKKVASLDCKDFERSKTYDLINRTQYDANAGMLGTVKTVFSLLSSAISTVSYIIIILRYSVIVFLIVVVPPIVRYFFEKKYNLLEYEVEKQNTEPSRKSSYISYLLTNAEHFKEIKVFQLFDFFIKKYRHIRTLCNLELIKVHNKRAITYGVLSIFEMAVDLGVTVFILIQAFNNIISIGKFVLYSNSIDSLKENIVLVFSQLSFLYRNSAMIEQIKEFFEMEDEDIHEDGVVVDKIDSVVFRNVSYKYQHQKEYVLRDISFTIEAGQTFVIMGYNGAGKSTLMKILMGIYNDYDGLILVNGIDRKTVNLQTYRDRLGVLFQDYIKYETSIKDNVVYGNLKIDQDANAVEDVMEKAQLHDLIERKEQQLGYQFNEGLQLSVGQWQKIALARTLISDSDLFIFDEPNASIDLMSENAILDAIMDDSKDVIKIVILHRFNKIVEKADGIITLKEGRVIENGKHMELLRNKSLYYELHSLQNEITPSNGLEGI